MVPHKYLNEDEKNIEFLNFGFGGFKKCHFFKFTNSQYFFTKILGTNSWGLMQLHCFAYYYAGVIWGWKAG